jgi:hypothetical protein
MSKTVAPARAAPSAVRGICCWCDQLSLPQHRWIGAEQPATTRCIFYFPCHLHIIIICSSMPPKRPLSDANSYQSPPPGHRNTHNGIDHHHSPLPGHHQETPSDAAVATSTPPRTNVRNDDENLSPTNVRSPNQIQDRSAGANNGISLPATTDNAEMLSVTAPTAMQSSPGALMQPDAVVSGGARAAYQASQQQRIITCNLSSIPPSK